MYLGNIADEQYYVVDEVIKSMELEINFVFSSFSLHSFRCRLVCTL